MELEHQIFPRSARDVKEATATGQERGGKPVGLQVAVGAHTLAAYSAPCAGRLDTGRPGVERRRRRCRSARARVTMESWR